MIYACICIPILMGVGLMMTCAPLLENINKEINNNDTDH
tara:strand:+ start:3555 stop:3671 length:117 start_codon:yes stop_codon:yes gene_type:complete